MIFNIKTCKFSSFLSFSSKAGPANQARRGNELCMIFLCLERNSCYGQAQIDLSPGYHDKQQVTLFDKAREWFAHVF
jgi:hypothetical protein